MNLPEITISVKVKRAPDYQPHLVKSSADLYELCKFIFDMDMINWREESIIIALNKRNEVLGYFKLSSGGTDLTIIDARIVYTVALNSLAHAIVVAHNHPSGTLRPSQADIQVTKKLKSYGELLGIPLIDHLIITETNYFSMLDNGLL